MFHWNFRWKPKSNLRPLLVQCDRYRELVHFGGSSTVQRVLFQVWFVASGQLIMRHLLHHLHLGSVKRWPVPGSAIRRAPGLVKFVTAVAYHFCLNLPRASSQPGARGLADSCRREQMHCADASNETAMCRLPISTELKFMRSRAHRGRNLWDRTDIIQSAFYFPPRRRLFRRAARLWSSPHKDVTR